MSHDSFSFFLCNIERVVVWSTSAKGNYCNLTKIAVNLRQASPKGVLLSVNALEYFGKIF